MFEMDDDKRTDKLFQEGANRHDFAYNPAAWEQMEVMLDQDLRRRWWLRAGILLTLLLVGTIAFFMLRNKSMAVDAMPDEQKQENINAPVVAKRDLLGTNQDIIALPDEQPSDETMESVAATHPQSAGIHPRANLERVVKATANSNIAQADYAKKAVTKTNVIKAHTGRLDLTEAKTEAVATEQEPSNLFAAEGAMRKQQAYSPVDLLEVISPKVFLGESSIPALSISSSSQALKATQTNPLGRKSKTEKVNNNGFALGAGFGRVYGGGGDQNFNNGKNRFGLEAAYRFGNKFGLSIGGYWGKVAYKATGEDYTAKAGFWTDGVVAKQVAASCKVLELPLQFSFHPAGNSNDGFFFNGGVTSYFLLQEDFQFKYDDPDHNGINAWQEINTNRHIMGLGQLGVGYQQHISKKTALQLEAYTQLPLTGIGQGKVKLTNIGITAKLLFDFRKR